MTADVSQSRHTAFIFQQSLSAGRRFDTHAWVTPSYTSMISPYYCHSGGGAERPVTQVCLHSRLAGAVQHTQHLIGVHMENLSYRCLVLYNLVQQLFKLIWSASVPALFILSRSKDDHRAYFKMLLSTPVNTSVLSCNHWSTTCWLTRNVHVCLYLSLKA